MLSLAEVIKDFYKKVRPNKRLQIDEEDRLVFNDATHCYICEKELGDDKVIDHDHFTVWFRGAAHNECNLNFWIPNHVPVIFHNLSGYDAHL